MKSLQTLSALGFITPAVWAQASCNAPSPSGNIRPSVASGYALQVVATGLARPRGILFDSDGNLLVVEAGVGRVSAHVLNDTNGCVTVASSSNVTGNESLNHGIEMSPDGRTLYASNTGDVYSWTYDSSARTVGDSTTLIANMTNSDHTTRTLLLSQKVPGMLVVSRGSTSNLDFQAAGLDSGHSQIKAFDLSNRSDTIYDFNVDGLLLGWGLRNDVGVAEHPQTGGIYSVENSADQLTRMGVDVHENNPGEELNFLGYLNGTSTSQQGGFFGYPWCFSVWNVTALPDNGNLTVGDQFAIDTSTDLNNENRTDAYCAEQVPARLVFQAHQAPLDIKFNNSGNDAYISFHGSWNRDDPTGYKVSVVSFNNGEPVDASDSLTAATDIVSNEDVSRCPDDCFRPVGLAFDSQGRMFMSSDASGEIYMISRTSNESTPTTSGSSPSSTSSQSAAAPCTNTPGWGLMTWISFVTFMYI